MLVLLLRLHVISGVDFPYGEIWSFKLFTLSRPCERQNVLSLSYVYFCDIIASYKAATVRSIGQRECQIDSWFSVILDASTSDVSNSKTKILKTSLNESSLLNHAVHHHETKERSHF